MQECHQGMSDVHHIIYQRQQHSDQSSDNAALTPGASSAKAPPATALTAVTAVPRTVGAAPQPSPADSNDSLQTGRLARSVTQLVQLPQQEARTAAAANGNATMQATSPSSPCGLSTPPTQQTAAGATASAATSSGLKRHRVSITRSDQEQWQDMLAFLKKSWPGAESTELDMIKVCKACLRKSGVHQGRCEWTFQLDDSDEWIRSVTELKKQIRERSGSSGTHGEAIAAAATAPPSSGQQPSSRPHTQVTQEPRHVHKHTAVSHTVAGCSSDASDEYGPLDPDEAAAASAAVCASRAWPVVGELSWLVPAGHQGPRAALIPLDMHYMQQRQQATQQAASHQQQQQQQLVGALQSPPDVADAINLPETATAPPPAAAAAAAAATTLQPSGIPDRLSMEEDDVTSKEAAAAKAAEPSGVKTAVAPPSPKQSAAAAARVVLASESVYQTAAAAAVPPAAEATAARVELSGMRLPAEPSAASDSSKGPSQHHLQQLANDVGTANAEQSKQLLQQQQQNKRKWSVAVKPTGLTPNLKEPTKGQVCQQSVSGGKRQQQVPREKRQRQQQIPSEPTMSRPHQLEMKDAGDCHQENAVLANTQQQSAAAAAAAAAASQQRHLTSHEQQRLQKQQQQQQQPPAAVAGQPRPLTFDERQRLRDQQQQQQQHMANSTEHQSSLKQQQEARPVATYEERQRLRGAGQDRQQQQQQAPEASRNSGRGGAVRAGLISKHLPPAADSRGDSGHCRDRGNRDRSSSERPGRTLKQRHQHQQGGQEQAAPAAEPGAADTKAAAPLAGVNTSVVLPLAEQEVVFLRAEHQRLLKGEIASQQQCAGLQQQLGEVQQQLQQRERENEMLRGQLAEVQHLQALLALLAQPELLQHCPTGLMEQQQQQQSWRLNL